MRSKKYIANVLLISFSILIIHNIIPHHHHISGIGEEHSKDHVCQAKHHHHSASCCHAFNELCFIKKGLGLVHPDNQPEVPLITVSRIEAGSTETPRSLFVPLKADISSPPTVVSRFLRGPPYTGIITA